jgi:hypothetical protein
MAKEIKFNLVCDGFPVRTIDELREHFSVEDIAQHYFGENQLLIKWLKIRGYNEYVEKIDKIVSQERNFVIKSLCEIFSIENYEKDLDVYFKINVENETTDYNDVENETTDYNDVINECKSEFYKLREKLYDSSNDTRFKILKTICKKYPFFWGAIDDYGRIIKGYFEYNSKRFMRAGGGDSMRAKEIESEDKICLVYNPHSLQFASSRSKKYTRRKCALSYGLSIVDSSYEIFYIIAND